MYSKCFFNFQFYIKVYDIVVGTRRKSLTKIIWNKLLKNARKNNVSVCISNHNFTDGISTKNTLNESNVIVFFMNNGFNSENLKFKYIYSRLTQQILSHTCFFVFAK